jgi:hypothetical protein
MLAAIFKVLFNLQFGRMLTTSAARRNIRLESACAVILPPDIQGGIRGLIGNHIIRANS